MKRAIVGSAMMLSGSISLAVWLLACSQTVEPGARSVVWGCVSYWSEWALVIFFAVLAIAGLVLALSSLKGKD